MPLVRCAVTLSPPSISFPLFANKKNTVPKQKYSYVYIIYYVDIYDVLYKWMKTKIIFVKTWKISKMKILYNMDNMYVYMLCIHSVLYTLDYIIWNFPNYVGWYYNTHNIVVVHKALSSLYIWYKMYTLWRWSTDLLVTDIWD